MLANGKSYGKCAYPDDITQLLQDVSQADVIAFGSPIYFFDITGELRCFLERLFYPYTAFKREGERVIAPRSIRTAFLYTMNVSEQEMKISGYEQNLAATLGWTQHIFTYTPATLYSCYTYQYDDYSKYVADLWNIEEKERQRKEQFPIDLKNAFELGKRLTEEAVSNN